MAAAGTAVRLPLTASGTEDGGSPARAVLTAYGMIMGGAGVRSALTASGTWGLVGNVGEGVATREPLSATGATRFANDSTGAPVREQYVALSYTVNANGGTREVLVATGTLLNGTVATGSAVRLAYDATGVFLPGNLGSGAAVLQARSARGVLGATNSTGSASMERRFALGTAIAGTVVTGGLSLLARTATGLAYNSTPSTGAAYMARRAAYGLASAPASATLHVWTMNTSNNAVTEYTSYPFNSYARYNGGYLGAGATGLYAIETGLTDNGANISWTVKTGLHDDKKPDLKRLTELLLSARYTGPLTVTVWKDEQVSYQYTMASYHPKYELHQSRVKIGKGMRSRHYQVQVAGVGARAEIDSMQLTLVPTMRRIG